MNFSELTDLDFDDIGGWPILAKVLGIALICIVILGAGYWFDTKEQLATLESAEKQENKLKAQFKSSAKKAANIALYKQQMVDMGQSFGAMLKQLPSKTEVAELLVDISQTGLASGLEFELFKVEAEVRRDFYAELPISIRVTGDYHEFGDFISGVAALPRIVTLHNFSIAKKKESKQLVMNVTAKTYRYIDELVRESKSTKKKKRR